MIIYRSCTAYWVKEKVFTVWFRKWTWNAHIVFRTSYHTSTSDWVNFYLWNCDSCISSSSLIYEMKKFILWWHCRISVFLLSNTSTHSGFRVSVCSLATDEFHLSVNLTQSRTSWLFRGRNSRDWMASFLTLEMHPVDKWENILLLSKWPAFDSDQWEGVWPRHCHSIPPHMGWGKRDSLLPEGCAFLMEPLWQKERCSNAGPDWREQFGWHGCSLSCTPDVISIVAVTVPFLSSLLSPATCTYSARDVSLLCLQAPGGGRGEEGKWGSCMWSLGGRAALNRKHDS